MLTLNYIFYTAHDGHAKDRVADFCKIIKSLDLPKSTLSSSFSMSSGKLDDLRTIYYSG